MRPWVLGKKQTRHLVILGEREPQQCCALLREEQAIPLNAHWLQGLEALSAFVAPATYIAALRWHEAALISAAEQARAAEADAAAAGGNAGPQSPSSPRSSIVSSSYLSSDAPPIVVPATRRPPPHMVPPVPITPATGGGDGSGGSVAPSVTTGKRVSVTGPDGKSAAHSATTAGPTPVTSARSVAGKGGKSGGAPLTGKSAAAAAAAAAAEAAAAVPEPPVSQPPPHVSGLSSIVAAFCVENVLRSSLAPATVELLQAMEDRCNLAGCTLVVP